jgi:hypothetical protein
VNAGEREIVCKKEREKKGSARRAATMPQSSTLRLIRNAAALAAASRTLLFSDRQNAARLKRNESERGFRLLRKSRHGHLQDQKHAEAG